ncbi:signal peptidase II [Arthrobacter pigmenti]|uniref:Lipoprotein signal peptidase n=1 Tax=Arthrobacter pigmenti TaxID=271432 RepID=A0A846RQU0_9MICC|nr:signal peptidase II [Arthrobacter pigmenti]NJC22095.1 signal peptidase II [Arthrobacter pigmenti]
MTEQPPVPNPESGRNHAKHGKRIGARYALLLVACTLIAYIFDQLTKIWVVSTMVEGQITEVLPPVLSWHFIRNSGAAFSIGTEITWVFTIIQALVSVAIITQIRKVASWGWAVALGLVLGGAVGNLTDRLFREPAFGQGHVVDFIALPNFAIFNIADSAVVSGVVLICLLTLRGIGLDGRRSNETENKEADNQEQKEAPDAGVNDDDRP